MEPVRRREPEKKKLQIEDLKGDRGGRRVGEVCQSASSLETAFGVKGKSRLHHLT